MKKQPSKPIPEPVTEPTPGFLAQLRGLDSWRRAVLILLLLAQLPMWVLFVNRGFNEYEMDPGPYFLMHVIERVRVGEPVYLQARPGASSPTYAPVSLWLVGYLCRIFGPSMIVGRMVGMLAMAFICFLLGRFVWKKTEDAFLSLAACSLWISIYGWMMPWWFLEIGPVNGMLVMFSFWAFYLLKENMSRQRALGLAAVCCLATFTKQTALAYTVAIGVWLLVQRNTRAAAVFISFCAIVIVGGAWALNVNTDGAFFRAVIGTAGAAPWLPERVWDEVLFPHYLGRFSLMIGLAAVPFILRSPKEWWALLWRPEYIMTGAGMVVGFIGTPKVGSGAQQSLVAFIGFIICGIIGLKELVKPLNARLAAGVAGWIVVVQLAALMVSLVVPYKHYLFDAGDRAIHDQIGQIFRSNDKVCFLTYPFYATRFGRPDNGQFGDELMMWKNHRLDFSDFPPSMIEPLVRQEYDYVLVPATAGNDPPTKAVVDNYTPVGQIGPHPKAGQGGPPLRKGVIIFKAKRLMGQPAGAPPVTIPAGL